MRGYRHWQNVRSARRESFHSADVGEGIERLNEPPQRDWIALVILLALGIGLGAIQNRFRASGKLDPVSLYVQRSTAPLARSFDSFFDGTTDFFSGIGNAKQLVEENRHLKQEREAMSHYLDSAVALDGQIRQLRELLDFETPGRTKIPADILEYVPYDNRITLSVGADKGIKPNLPVVSGSGLLGIVSTVDKKTSQVILLTSTSVKIGGLVIGPPHVPGIVQGQSMRRLVMDITVSDDVAPGAAVMTTGYSQFIPRGIRIGTVIESYRDEDSGVRRAVILPAAVIGLGKEVVVLK